MSTLYQGLFYYYGSSFVPFDSPLWHFKQDSPDGLLLFSLAEPESPNVAPFELGSDLALVVNLTRVSLQARKYLKSKVWPGCIFSFVHPSDQYPYTLDPDPPVRSTDPRCAATSPSRSNLTLSSTAASSLPPSGDSVPGFGGLREPQVLFTTLTPLYDVLAQQRDRTLGDEQAGRAGPDARQGIVVHDFDPSCQNIVCSFRSRIEQKIAALVSRVEA